MLELNNKNMDNVYKHLWHAWSRNTARSSGVWNPENPGFLQDDVTALVVNDLFGGEIAVGTVSEKEDVFRVYFNIIGGETKVDLTKSIDMHSLGNYMIIGRETLYNLCPSRYHKLADRVYTKRIMSLDAGNVSEFVLDALYYNGIIEEPINVLTVTTITLNDISLYGVYEVPEGEECTD